MQEVNTTQPMKVFPGLAEAEMRDYGLTMPPTQDELPYTDGMPEALLARYRETFGELPKEID